MAASSDLTYIAIYTILRLESVSKDVEKGEFMSIDYVEKCTYGKDTVTLLLNIKNNKKGEKTYSKEELKEAINLLQSFGFEDKVQELQQVLKNWPRKYTSIKGEVHCKQTA